MGYVPIIVVAVATSFGAGISDALGLTVVPGGIVVGAAGFFVSRAMLRWYFRPRPHVALEAPRSSSSED